MFAIHLLLLVAFLLPLVSKAAFWVTVGQAEEAVAKNEEVQKVWKEIEPLKEKGSEVAQKVTDKSLKWQKTRVAYILIGLHRGYVICFLAFCGIVYNALRFILTYYVGLLRDREQQGSRSPGKNEYLGLFRLHILANALIYPLAIFFIVTFLDWMAQPVLIPISG